MILHNEYLTDEELEQLISEVESDKLVPANPELEERIISELFGASENKLKIIAEDRQVKQKNATAKKREFAAYCFRVGISVAAAIAFVFIMPYLPGLGNVGENAGQCEYMDKETYLRENAEWTHIEEGELLEEGAGNNEVQREMLANCPSREDVLNDKSILRRVLEGETIFKDDNLETDLKQEYGGQ